MKKSYFSKGFIAFFAMCMGLTVMSCSKEEVVEETVTLNLTVDVDTLLLSQDGSSQSIRITSNTDWVITGNAEWLTVSHVYGSGDKAVVLTPSVNEEYTARRCVLTIAMESGESSCQVEVVQAASSLLGLSDVMFTLGGVKGSEGTLKITTNSDWTITDVPEWLTLSAVSGKGSANVTLTSNSSNYSFESRECVLELVAGTESTILLVTQNAGLSEYYTVEAANEITLCDGYYADLSFQVTYDVYYKELVFDKAEFEQYSEQEIWEMVLAQEYSYRASKYDYTMWNLEKAETEYVYCAVAFDPYDDVYGMLSVTHFKTRSAESKCDAPIGEITYTDDYGEESWIVPFTMEEECQYYYTLGSNGDYADTRNEEYTNIDLAYGILYQQEQYEGLYLPKYESGVYNWDRSGEYSWSDPETRFFVWSWGVDFNGEYSSCISKKYINIEEDEVTEAPQCVAPKKDKVKLTRDELNEKVSNLKVSINRVGM